jgi:hypothetical protein
MVLNLSEGFKMSDESIKPRGIGGVPALYKEEYDQLLIQHMSQGYSFESFCATINVGRRTLFDWIDRYESFKEAKSIGHEKAKQVFETVLISKIRGQDTKGINIKNSDTACLIFALKTRFKESYSEKIEHSVSSDIKIVIDSSDNDL